MQHQFKILPWLVVSIHNFGHLKKFHFSIMVAILEEGQAFQM
jgi:hypothetical protein